MLVHQQSPYISILNLKMMRKHKILNAPNFYDLEHVISLNIYDDDSKPNKKIFLLI